MCKYCGAKDGCTYLGLYMVELDRQGYDMRKGDWQDIYWFMKYVYLPFMHRIAQRVLDRGKRNVQTETATVSLDRAASAGTGSPEDGPRLCSHRLV